MAFGFAAPKLLPMAELMDALPRFTRADDTMPAGLLLRALFSRDEDIDPQAFGAPYGYYEYGAYLSPLALLLAIVGIAWRRRPAAAWLLIALSAIALAGGQAFGGDSSPWALLHRLPVFASQRAP